MTKVPYLKSITEVASLNSSQIVRQNFIKTLIHQQGETKSF